MHRTYRLNRDVDQATGVLLSATHYRLAAVALLALTVYGLFIPLRFRAQTLDEAMASFRAITYFDASLIGARGDWVASIVQFAALGFVIMGAIAVDRRRSVAIAAAVIVVPALIGLIYGLEFLQVYFPPRTISWNDVIVESFGAMAGVTFWIVAGPFLTNWCRRTRGARGLPALATQLLPAYLSVLLVVELMPFDFVFDGGELAMKAREGKIHLWPTDAREAILKAGMSMTIFFPLGFLAALVRKAPSSIDGWPWALGLGFAAASLIEGLQLLVYSRHFNLADVGTGSAGVALGWWIARTIKIGSLIEKITSRFNRPAAWGLLVVGWFAVVATLNWQPFHFTTERARFVADGELTDEQTSIVGLRRLNLAPLVDYYWSSKYNAGDQFVKKSLSFAPLGFLIGLRTPRYRKFSKTALTMLAALAAGFLIELGQYFIPERHPSTSDLLIGCLGSLLGMAGSHYLISALRPEPIMSWSHR